MSTFSITKMPTLATYVLVLRAMGAPVHAGLQRARLRTLFEEIPDAWISYERLRCFTADMSVREGIPELGLIPGSADLDRGLCKALIEPVLRSPTLFRALQAIPSLTSRQTPDIRFWSESAGDQDRACLLLPLPPEVPGYAIGETRTLGVIENIIRAFVGHDFAPTRALLASRPGDLNFSLESAYGGVPVRTGRPYGAIEFPRALLSSSAVPAGARTASSSTLKPGEAPPASFSATLEACLEPYLCETYPDINLAAEIAYPAHWFHAHGARLDLNIVNWSFLAACLLLARSPVELAGALAPAGRMVVLVLLQYPIYGGIMGIMLGTGFAARTAALCAAFGSTETLPLVAFISAAVINFFIPSGGAQWAVQAPAFLEAAQTLGTDPALIVMAVAYGDQWTNIIHPFAEIPLLLLTGLAAGKVLAYSFLLFLVAGVPLATALLVASL
jgi:hypothetical protein